MPRAVRFDRYGGVDVLEVVEVPAPVPGPGELLVRVKVVGINPGEAKIREGLLPNAGRRRFRRARAATSPGPSSSWAMVSRVAPAFSLAFQLG